MTTYQVIFESANGRDGAWLDYCREPIEADTDEAVTCMAQLMAESLAKRLGCGARARIENWNNGQYGPRGGHWRVEES